MSRVFKNRTFPWLQGLSEITLVVQTKDTETLTEALNANTFTVLFSESEDL